MVEQKCKDKDVCEISNLMEFFGKYQIIQYFLINLPAMFATMTSINYIFVAGDINYRCRVPECEGQNSTSFYPSWWPNSTIDQCSRPVLRQDAEPLCTNSSFSDDLQTCTDFVYETNDTVIAALDLACHPWKANLIGTINSTGMLVSMLVSGWISDRFGRKPAFIFCVVGASIGVLKTFATTYYVYVTIEFLEAAATGGSYTAAMVILLEIASTKYRLLAGVLFSCTIYIGECLFACIAMFVPYWKTIIYVVYGPLIIFISNIFTMYESPRWQIVSGRHEKAKETMKRMARINKININYEELYALTEVELKEKFDIAEHQIKESYGEIFRSKVIMMRLVVVGWCRFTSNFVYYGLMINSVWLPGDKYVNFLLSTVMSFPGELICLYLMNKFGRRFPLMGGFILCGILCAVSALVPDRYFWLKIVLFLTGKMIISACFTGAITYTMELFPTSVRGTLLGFGAFASRVGGMAAPLTPVLTTVSTALPFTIFGCFAISTGILLILTPETKGVPLFDTIKQLEENDRVGRIKKVEKKEEKRRKKVDCSLETVVSSY